jgi:uncharacterized membrane protein
VACGLWLVACGLWLVACGLWLVACGLWLVACGLWLVACGLWLNVVCFIVIILKWLKIVILFQRYSKNPNNKEIKC